MIVTKALIKILSDGKYHSGTELGGQFNVSRAAIGKMIKKIEKDFSLNIYAVKGKGYRLQSKLELLDEALIRPLLSLNTLNHLTMCELFFDIDSTNHYLNNKSVDGAASGYLVLAEQQTKGAGRRGRTWESPFGCNLYLSLLWRFQCGAAQLSCLSLFIAVAIVRALKKTGAMDVCVKWPNDIYCNNKKLGGILLEMRGELSGPSAVVIGIGLNISMTTTGNDTINIDQPWIDLESILKKSVKRNDFIALVINNLFDVIGELPNQENNLLEEWQEMDMLKDQNIEVSFAGKTIQGVASGINRDGALLVSHQGKEIICHSGEVSIRRE